MPIYEFECRNCGTRFEALWSISEIDAEVRCPECGDGCPQRVVSVFAPRSSVYTPTSWGPT
ncbi:MAG: zinc ribbon domain-containing protein [Dehalococcoidales bacterium]|nr:zinc ribbon domain-containing protein [Dehalococcoidales bacterium]